MGIKGEVKRRAGKGREGQGRTGRAGRTGGTGRAGRAERAGQKAGGTGEAERQTCDPTAIPGKPGLHPSSQSLQPNGSRPAREVGPPAL